MNNILKLTLLAVAGIALTGCKTLRCPASSCGGDEYRHVVLFKFKDSASTEQVVAIEKAFAGLPDRISTIRDFEWGVDVSPEGKADGFTHCFLVTFDDKAGLDVYIPHPAHKAFVDLLLPSLDKVLVIDYVAQK
jgi:hypothetical protein